MADTTPLRQPASVRNPALDEASSQPRPVKMGELPHVQMKPAPAGPQFLTPPPKAVAILPPRNEKSALRTGGLPMVNVRMTSQGPQLDNGQQDKAVVILPMKDQKKNVSAGGLPMLDVKMTSTGPQVQNQPSAQKAPPQIQSAHPAVSQPRRAFGAAPTVNKGRVVHVPAPKVVPVVPPLPEFSADQLMLCRHLADKYLVDLREEYSAEGTPSETSKEAPEGFVQLVQLVEATIGMIDQALVTVAVRAEATSAGEAVTEGGVEEALAPAASPPVASIIPAAPSASYVAGRVGGHSGGYVQKRPSGQAPRRVMRSSDLPMVEVKMTSGRAVVQNQQEVHAARVAAATGERPGVEGQDADSARG